MTLMNKERIEQSIERRLPAEWEAHGAVLLSWPHAGTDWAYMLEEVTGCFVRIAEAIVEDELLIVVAPDVELPKKHLSHLRQDRITYLSIPTDDTWARDFGAIVTYENGEAVINDFKFNGWGLKFRSCNDNLITRGMVDAGVLKGKYCNRLGFVLEGGSIESDGQGLLLTTTECLMSPNRNGDKTKEDIEAYLSDAFGLRKMLWLDHGALEGDDTDSHTDTLARLAPNNTILYVGTNNEDDSHYEGLKNMREQLVGFTNADGQPMNLIELPLPDPIYDEDGQRLPATYANYLVTPKSVLMPSYCQDRNDVLASQILKIAFPDREIKMIDCRALIKQHGSLHCVTMQLPNEALAL